MPHIVRRGHTAAPVLLYGFFGLFIAAIVYLVASSLSRRSVTTYAPTAELPKRTPRDGRSADTLTIDATNTDRWTYVSLTDRAVLAPPDSSGWELAVRRYQIRSSGTVADVGDESFDMAREHVTGLQRSAARGTEQRTELGHWYSYSWLTHLLEPRGDVYLIRSASGREFTLRILSYYCPGPRAGCVTLQYASVSASGA